MRIKRILAAAAMLFAGIFATADAAPITYKLTGQLDGSLGVTPITGGSFTWTITADTTNVVLFAPGFFINPAITSSITIAGYGTAVPAATIWFAIVPSIGQAGFVAPLTSSGIAVDALPLFGYDPTMPFAPQTVVPVAFSTVLTDHGALAFTNLSSLVFQASTVPEPVTLALFGAGLAGLGLLRRRREARATRRTTL